MKGSYEIKKLYGGAGRGYGVEEEFVLGSAGKSSRLPITNSPLAFRIWQLLPGPYQFQPAPYQFRKYPCP